MKTFQVCLLSDSKNYMIGFTDNFSLYQYKGYHYTSSYHVLCARLLGLSYPDYLRFCQSKGARLSGKKGYCHPVWSDKNKCQEVVNLIEKEWNILMSEIKFNNWN